MELNLTKEKVQEAAVLCPDAKNVLKVLFPEAFSASHTIDLHQLADPPGSTVLVQYEKCLKAGFNGYPIEVRGRGEYAGRGFYLNAHPISGIHGEWKIVKDSEATLVLLYE